MPSLDAMKNTTFNKIHAAALSIAAVVSKSARRRSGRDSPASASIAAATFSTSNGPAEFHMLQ